MSLAMDDRVEVLAGERKGEFGRIEATSFQGYVGLTMEGGKSSIYWIKSSKVRKVSHAKEEATKTKG
jgi:ribosomal protein L24